MKLAVIVLFYLYLPSQANNELTAKFPCEYDSKYNDDHPQVPENVETLILYGPNNLNSNWKTNLDFMARQNTHTINITNCPIHREESIYVGDYYPNLQNLYMINMNLTQINFEEMANLPRLQRLIFDNNTNLSNFYGEIKVSLFYISLRNTNFHDVPINALSQFKYLKELYISRADGREFTMTGEEVCAKIPSLKIYNQKNCEDYKIKEVEKPKDTSEKSAGSHNTCAVYSVVLCLIFISGFTMKRNLYLYGLIIILITLFSSSFAEVFQPVDLRNQNIEAVNTKLFDQFDTNYITDIYLENNLIKAIAYDSFEKMPRLRYLYLSNNQLTSLEFISASVENLHANNNLIESIDNKIFNSLPLLNEFIVSNNKLSKVNWDLSALENIYSIDLSNNSLLTDVSIRSEKLEVLTLSNNYIENLNLDTPRLYLLHFLNGKYAKGDLNEICKDHKSMTFMISYIREDTEVADYYKCNNGVGPESEIPFQAYQQAEALPSPPTKLGFARAPLEPLPVENVQEKLVGCEYSTLRANITQGDIILTAHEYRMLYVYFTILCSCIVALILFNFWMLLKIVHIHNRPDFSQGVLMRSGRSKQVATSVYV